MIDPLGRWEDGDKPDYAGLLTYAGMPYTEDAAELAGVDVAIVGAPIDDLVTGQPGTRFGPRAIRGASTLPGAHLDAGIDGFDGAARGRLRRRARGARPTPARSLAAIERTVGEVVDAGAVPIVLGGDHSIAEPDIRACAQRHGPVGLDPLRHPHRHRRGALRRRGLARHADVPAGRAGPRRPRAVRADRPPRLLAGRAGVRLAGRARDHEPSSCATSASTGSAAVVERAAGGRRRAARPSSRSTSTSSTPPSPPGPGLPSPAG